jgi:hypothetical protein
MTIKEGGAPPDVVFCVKRTSSPSGDQTGEVFTRVSLREMLSQGRPRDSIYQIWVGPARVVTNEIYCPSGDQEGWKSDETLFEREEAWLFSRSRTHI